MGCFENTLDGALRYWPLVGCGGILSLVLIILMGTSAKLLGPYDYGLKQNGITGKVALDDGVYEPGVYFIGFWNHFVTFPKTIQTIQYSFEKPEMGVQHLNPLHLRSKDKQTLYLEVSVQYQRIKAGLIPLFGKAMTPLLQENVFVSNLRAELTKVMSSHNAADCWIKRDELIGEFFEACKTVLYRDQAVCWGLQFYRSHMGDKYEGELIRTQVQKQQKLIEEARKRATEVRSKTQVVLADYQSNITVLKAEAAAERYNIEVAAKTAAESSRIQAEAEALSDVKNLLNISGVPMSEVQLAEYQKNLMLAASLTEAKLFYGLSTPPQYIGMGRRMEDPNLPTQGWRRRLEDIKADEPKVTVPVTNNANNAKSTQGEEEDAATAFASAHFEI